MAEAKEVPDWTYEHPADHPDNKPPVTAVAVPSEEAVAQYEAAVNAELAKGQPDTLTKEEEARAKAAGGPAAVAPVDYESKTVAELKETAAEKGIDLPWDARKDEIVKALEKHDKKGK
jgi:flavoprotein